MFSTAETHMQIAPTHNWLQGNANPLRYTQMSGEEILGFR